MVNQVTLNVQGMSCGHCVSSVENSVGKLDGVNEVKVLFSFEEYSEEKLLTLFEIIESKS